MKQNINDKKTIDTKIKKQKSTIPNNSFSEFLLYKTPNGNVKIEVFLHDENLWLTQKKMAELFDVNVPAVNKHLTNIYNEEELKKEATISNLEIVQQEGERQVKRIQTFYNLDAWI